ncbi:MAG: FtsK/SpoIIIE domain-containing protein [Blastocatellia bacterium]
MTASWTMSANEEQRGKGYPLSTKRNGRPKPFVSSKSSLTLLEVLVRRRLTDLNLGLSDQELDELTTRFINEANSVSGDIVLCAAKRGRFASELMGVVLSKSLLAAEMGKDASIGWYFLDDYASWLGQKEEQIADIMAICPKVDGDKRYLKIIVSEAKYVSDEGLAEAKKNSSKQLWDTVRRIEDAVFGRPGRLDRDLWLSRISDIMLEGIEQISNSSIQIEEWRKDLREGRLLIDLSGYSQVFISGPNGSTKGCEQTPIPKVNRCLQEVFSRDQVRDLVLAIYRKESLSQVRQRLGSERPWKQDKPEKPADKVSWVKAVEATTEREAQSQHAGQPQGGVDDTVIMAGNSNVPNPARNTEADDSQAVVSANANAQKLQIPDSEPAPFLLSNEGGHSANGVEGWIKARAIQSETDEAAQKWLHETVQRLKTALISYELQAQVLDQRLTPNAALIQLRGTDRLTVHGIEAKRTELLTTHALKLINVSAQPGRILVSIARPEREAITLANVWVRRKLNNVGGINLSLVVGVKEIDGEILYLNLGSEFESLQQHAPHTLIAGATGSGKSILLRNLLLDICTTNSPEMARIYLIDPKAGVDYFTLEGLPHLGEGIITEQHQAIDILEDVVIEMDRRYAVFRENKATNLAAFNAKVASEKKLPVLWVVHDEFAEWMLVDDYKDRVSAVVQRLGVKARAAGIYLIFAAQRPDATVLPVQLRDNLGNRLILRVESVGTSEISLGQKGAENLLGKGHIIARLSGEPDFIFAQVPLISDTDAESLVEIVRGNIESRDIL